MLTLHLSAGAIVGPNYIFIPESVCLFHFMQFFE